MNQFMKFFEHVPNVDPPTLPNLNDSNAPVLVLEPETELTSIQPIGPVLLNTTMTTATRPMPLTELNLLKLLVATFIVMFHTPNVPLIVKPNAPTKATSGSLSTAKPFLFLVNNPESLATGPNALLVVPNENPDSKSDSTNGAIHINANVTMLINHALLGASGAHGAIVRIRPRDELEIATTRRKTSLPKATNAQATPTKTAHVNMLTLLTPVLTLC